MKKIVVTGAAGFIGCNLARELNALGYTDLILVDSFGNEAKEKNLAGVSFSEKVERENFHEWLNENGHEVAFVFHLGARTDTTEFNFRVLDSLNLSYSKTIWETCTVKQIPLLYASSAATYGAGEHGFSDNHELIKNLKPLNPYGLSKQLFDLFVLEQKNTPPFWCGLKFFNVYGPYEFHKGRMASVVLHAYKQIRETGKVKLFKSHRPDFKDGEQLRDFIYVADIVAICLWFFTHAVSAPSAIYNAGTGKARTFNHLATAIFNAMQLPVSIEYTDIPADIRDKYQYYTQADTAKLHAAGYEQKFTSLEEGVQKYVDFMLRN
ncbi:MAG: ADP-glyceromanno-heptose 6-epimerase [Chitinophagales bacterium]|nr:ADP-glyceromanno-heptose 6-epimerase [Chitinophagales bacterium]